MRLQEKRPIFASPPCCFLRCPVLPELLGKNLAEPVSRKDELEAAEASLCLGTEAYGNRWEVESSCFAWLWIFPRLDSVMKRPLTFQNVWSVWSGNAMGGCWASWTWSSGHWMKFLVYWSQDSPDKTTLLFGIPLFGRLVGVEMSHSQTLDSPGSTGCHIIEMSWSFLSPCHLSHPNCGWVGLNQIISRDYSTMSFCP